jgi:Zn-dependent protease with chaperone function
MQFLLLICLWIACLPIRWPAPPSRLGEPGAVAAVGTLVLLLLLTAALISRFTCRAFRRNPEKRQTIAHYYGVARTWFFFATLGVFAASLLLLGWGWTAVRIGTVEIDGRSLLIPGGELLVLAPFLVVQIGSWVFTYDAARIIHFELVVKDRDQPFWSRWGYVVNLFRQLLIVFLPLILLIVALAFTRLFPDSEQKLWTLLSLIGMIGLSVGFPLLLPALLPLRRLAPGPARERFEACARRIGFRYRRVYVWETRSADANALILGVVPWLRDVVVSDRLLADLSDEEFQAVIGHEMGHAYHGHLLYYMFFFFSSMICLACIAIALDPFIGVSVREYSTTRLILPILTMGAYLFLVFGFISRRCERQADLIGCRAGSCDRFDCVGHDAATIYVDGGLGLCTTGINSFVAALNKVVEINSLRHGTPPDRKIGKWRRKVKQFLGWIVETIDQWIHSTVAKRTDFLLRVIENPEIERRFQRRFYVMRWAIALAILGTIAAIGLWRGWEFLWNSL